MSWHCKKALTLQKPVRVLKKKSRILIPDWLGLSGKKHWTMNEVLR